jgi:NAD-dependent dihydropyrimidine dehydrogenase PreA subunit
VSLRYWFVNVVQTLLRLFPFPCRTGLVEIGDPGPSSPVLLTCNFGLTVKRVQRALRGLDVYLLIANSRGVNVWCAATGGLLTNHDVVSVLKTSGIEDRVDHRQVILPQLAATGIEGSVIHKKAGWRIVWGPVEADGLPAFLRGARQTTREMRTVTFPWRQRFEMAVAWAFPISLLSLLLLPFWREGVGPLIALVWGLSMLLFLSFPLYHELLAPGRVRSGFIGAFGPRGVPLLFWAGFGVALIGTQLLVGDFSWTETLRWGGIALGVLLILGLDLAGSTPVYKSGLHADRWLRITLDAERCKGAGFCEQVCPVDVFEVDPEKRMASLPRVARCVQCGACIVQCPFDALDFRSPKGEVLSPETVRKFKLNLQGKRLVRVDPTAPS